MEFLKKNFYILFFALIISSCVDNPNPLISTNTFTELYPTYLYNNGNGKSIIDSLFPELHHEIDALHNVGAMYSSINGIENVDGSAIFTDMNNKVISVERIQLNENYLYNDFDIDRPYRLYSNGFAIPKHEKNNLLWEVFTKQGIEYVKLLSMSKKIEFPDFAPFDTVDISNGLNFTYTGADSGEAIIELHFENELTYNLVDPDSSFSGGGRLLLRVPDNGKISISSDYLGSILSNRIFTLTLLHFKYEEDSFEIRKIGYFTSYTTSIPLFLKR